MPCGCNLFQRRRGTRGLELRITPVAGAALTDADAAAPPASPVGWVPGRTRHLALRFAPSLPGNYAMKVWEGGEGLSGHLVRHPQLVRGKRCVELGSGVGVVGLTAAALGARCVLLTDLPDALPYLRYSAATSNSHTDAASATCGCSLCHVRLQPP